MAITRDTANEPAAVTKTTAWNSGAPLTTASKTYQAGTLLVAVVAGGNNSASVTATVTDSASGSWSLLARANTTGSGGFAGTAEVWIRYLASGATLTVTATASSTSPGGQLRVYALLGAASTQAGATGTISRTTAGALQASVAAGTGSLIVGAAYDWTSNTALTALGNTTETDGYSDTSNGVRCIALTSTGATAGTATYGFSSSVQGQLAMAEIQAAAGDTPVTGTESGTATDTSVLAASSSSTDSSALGEATVTNATVTGTEAALAAEVTSTTVTLAASDGGTVSESADVDTGAPPEYVTVTGLPDSAGPALTPANDGGTITLAVGFEVAGRSDCVLSGVEIAIPPGANVGDGTGLIGYAWTSSTDTDIDTQLATANLPTVASDATFYGVDFDPIAMDAGKTYWVGVYLPLGNYGYTAHAFDSDVAFDDLAEGTFPASSSLTDGNGQFATGAAGSFPSGSFNATSYGVRPRIGVPIEAKTGSDGGTLDETSDLGSLSNPTASDDVSATDTSTLLALPTGSDTATLAEATLVGSDHDGTDGATLAETTDTLVSDTLAEGTLTDTGTLVVTIASTDGGTVTDTSALSGSSNPAANDGGVLSESATVVVTLTASEAATLTELAALLAAHDGTDTGALVEATSLIADGNPSSSDTGTLTETAGVVATLVRTDAAVLTELAQAIDLDTRRDLTVLSAKPLPAKYRTEPLPARYRGAPL